MLAMNQVIEVLWEQFSGHSVCVFSSCDIIWLMSS